MSALSKGCRGTGSMNDGFAYRNIYGLIFHGCCPAAWPGGCQAGRSWHPIPWQSSAAAPPDPAHTPSPTASLGLHPALISACCLAVPWWLQGQRSPLRPSLYTPVIFNSAYANPESGMSSGRGPRGNGHGANFLPFLPLFLYNIQQRFSSTS